MEQGMVGCGVGSIVWVRRRNGSWWPGKILGVDQLSASHVMSPRSGTPVKLLGREDASVDWYNLEKSKRVKAFRCGEFNDCIERAEASLGVPLKKREKYARREDAILHALELEKELVGKKYGDINNKIDKSSDDILRREAVTPFLQSENHKGEHFHLTSDADGLSLMGKNIVDILSIAQKENPLSMDDYSRVLLNMRALQDVGLCSVPCEDKFPVSSIGAFLDVPRSNFLIDGSPRDEVIVNGGKVNLFAEDRLVIKRHDEHKQLVQVLQNSEKFPVSSYLQPDSSSHFTSVLGDEQSGIVRMKKARYTNLVASESRDVSSSKRIVDLPPQIEILAPNFERNMALQHGVLCEENTSISTECTETDSPESDSQVSDRDADMTIFSESAASIELQPKYFGRFEAPAEHGSTHSEELDDVSVAHCRPALDYNTVPAGAGISKWKLKGKRNNRNVVRRSFDAFEANRFRTANNMTGRSTSGKGSCGGRSKVTSFLKTSEAPVEQLIINGSKLVDVDLKVQVSYHRQRVPMISLMSKVNNGQAIVGHPIPVEALDENCAFESSLGVADVSPENDSSLQLVWRTARRTAGVRVPRPNIILSSGLDGTKITKPLAATDSSGQKPRMTRKNISRLPRTVKTLSRKTSKRISLSCNHHHHQKKIRTLSSISTQQKQSDLKQIFQANGLMKEDTVPTGIACIPVKLVFSRLNGGFAGLPK